MVVLDEGMSRIRSLIYTDINKGEVGTSGTAATTSDTDLLAPLTATLFTLDTKSVGTKSLKFDYVLPSTYTATTTVKEFKLNASDADVDYDRIVYVGIDWDDSETKQLRITKIYYLNSA
jgi:hypothetical protein